MKAHTYEKTFLAVGGVTLVACMGALVYATFGMGKHLPGIGGHVDPQRAYQSPPFDRLGVTQVGPNRYEAILVGQMFAFIPPEIRVPVGAQIDKFSMDIDGRRTEAERRAAAELVHVHGAQDPELRQLRLGKGPETRQEAHQGTRPERP